MKWFINQSNKIQGPFDNSEVPSILQRTGGQSVFLWSRGMSEWIHADKWTPLLSQNKDVERDLGSLPAKSEQQVRFSLSLPPEKKSEKESVSMEKFKVRYNMVDQPMMNKDELLVFTMKQDDVSKIAVYDSFSKEWREIYAIPEIADKLGLSRRKNARVPILAQFVGASFKGAKLNSRVVTISVAGMGLTNTFDLNIGDNIRGQITSPHFFTPLNIEAEVTYTGTDGYIGLRFSQINDDTLALITEYVNKFSDKI